MARAKLFMYASRIEASAERVFRWHAEPGALARLTPPWEKMEVVEPAPGICNGDRGVLRVHFGPIPMLWKFEHSDYQEGRQFRDVQTAGPFRVGSTRIYLSRMAPMLAVLKTESGTSFHLARWEIC
ncbi:MAG: hypothetical protein WAL95_06705 [Candidatus Acidiferrales bacterium]